MLRGPACSSDVGCRRLAALLGTVLAIASGCDGGRKLTITTASQLPDGVVGRPYSLRLSYVFADSSPPRTPVWSLQSGSLPDGLTLCDFGFGPPGECMGGTISGTPLALGISTFVIGVEDRSVADAKSFTLTIDPAPGGTGTLHFSWTVNGGLAQCADRQVKLTAGSFSTTRPCSDGAFDASLPSGTYAAVFTLLDAQGQPIGDATPGFPTPAFLTGGTTVQVSADLAPFSASVTATWTVDGAAPGAACALSGIGDIAVSFGGNGHFTSDTRVPCPDGSHTFAGVTPATTTVRATPLRPDGRCFQKQDLSCLQAEVPVTLTPAGHTDVSLVIPRTTGIISMSWTIDGLTPTQALCDSRGLVSVEISVSVAGGPVLLITSPRCADGSASVEFPAGLSYQLDGSLQTASATVDRRSTAPFLVDYAVVTAAPVLAFSAGTPSSCSVSGGTDEPATVASDTTWTKAAGPHRVPPFFAVTSGALLTIEAGAVVCIQVGQRFQVGGDGTDARLAVAGTDTDPVVFRGIPDGAFFDAITIGVPATSTTQNLISGARVFNGRLIASGNVSINDTRFEGGTTVVLGSSGASYSLVNSSIVGTRGPGLRVNGPPTGSVANVRIAGGDSVGVDVFTGSFTLVDSEVTGNAGDGIFVEAGLSGTGVGISGCNLLDNGGVGVSTQSPGLVVDATGNYWGDPGGPTGAQGDGVGAGVTVSSFRTTPAAVGPFP